MRPFYFISARRRKFIANFNERPNNNFGPKRDRYNGDLVNEKIRFPEVLVIGPDGTSYGKMSRFEAYKKAESMELDLLCVAPQGNPPVCKILNYGKYKFDAQKKAKEAKKNQKIIEIKEIQLTPQIGLHDLETKVKAAIKFLEDGNKVKVGVRFKGRQMSHTEIGDETMNKFLEYVKDYSTIEKKPNLDGRWLTCVLASKAKK